MSEKKEKLKREFMDGTALTFAEKTERQNQLVVLRKQLAVLQTQLDLPGLGIKRILHQ